MIFGGFSTLDHTCPRPEGAQSLAAGSSGWRLGEGQPHTSVVEAGHRRVLVLGQCGATAGELRQLAEMPVPADVTWRWPGAYTVVEETVEAVVVHTDPVAAHPVYAASYRHTWAWCTSPRTLAALTGATVDIQRLACAVFLPSIPALAGSRSFFTAVEQLPPGSRVELPSDGGRLRRTTTWRPDPVSGHRPHQRLRAALTSAVTLRVAHDPGLSCDMSGGLDSTTVALLAATALPPGLRLDAVTIHPEDDLDGADLRYARLAAAAHPTRLSHHLLPLSRRHLPYTAITDVPATDEPAPSTLTQARLTAQLHWMHDRLGSRTHLTGDGGDSVLFQPPIHLADLVRHHRWRRALGEAAGWARLRHTTVPAVLREAISTAAVGRSEALARLVRDIGAPTRNDHGHVQWFPLLPFPTFANTSVQHLLVHAAQQAAAAADPMPNLDAAVRTLVDDIREVARSAGADAALAGGCGVDLDNPLLDPAVVDTILTVQLDERPRVHTYKPLLSGAGRHVLPVAVANRSTKGSFDADHYTGMRTNLPQLLSLADGHLAALGLIDPAPFRRHVRRAAAGVPMPLATVEQALAAEAWLVAHHRDPAPVWSTTRPGSARD